MLEIPVVNPGPCRPANPRRLPLGMALVAAVFIAAEGVRPTNACAAPASSPADHSLWAGFAETDITPAIEAGKPVYLAGYGFNRPATGVHDPLLARCVVIHDRERDRKIGIVSVDLVGLQLPTVRQVQAQLKDFAYVVVSSTHNHEGPDTIGIWGKTPFQRGVDDNYLALVVERVVAAIRAAEKSLSPVRASFGTADDESLLHDSRQPYVLDPVLRVIRFDPLDGAKPAGLLVQWNCHPEALGSGNTLVTADFPAATVAELTKRYACPVVYVTGAVGGLMAPPSGQIHNAEGKPLRTGEFEFAEAYGRRVAELAIKAVDRALPCRLTPCQVSAKPLAVPLSNRLYRAAQAAGVLRREPRLWTGDCEQLGRPMTLADLGQQPAVETEVACLRLGDLYVACIPGEIYPELVYGRYQEPADPAADYPEAEREPSVADILAEKKWLLFGLANDEIGYLIPRRQWDQSPPFAYGRDSSQYGEINSCGPDAAPIVMQALTRRVKELDAPAPSPGGENRDSE